MKDVNIQIRISEEMKNDFYKKCEENLQTPSVILRELIKEYTKRGMEIFKEEDK